VKQRWSDYALLVACLLALWQGAYYVVGAEALTPPLETARRLVALIATQGFWGHARATGIAFLYASVLALVGGMVMGVAIGSSKMAHEIFSPILGTLYSIPKLMLYPVILLVFGLGLSAKVAFGAIHGFFPVALFTIGAIRNLPPVMLRTGRVLQLSWPSLVRHIYLPACLPEIVTGLRIGFSTTLLGTLIGELFASSEGLGFLLSRAMDTHNVPDIMALTLLLFLIATGANTIILAVEYRLQAHAR
jgi:NitT/TauT family transport system permease protein